MLEEARQPRPSFDESDLDGREDFTDETDHHHRPGRRPRLRRRHLADAATQDTGHWLLGVHIADVGHFAPPGGALDREARTRGTSVYLPQRVIPMFPELISNGLASLQQGKVRYVKSAFMEFTPEGQTASTRASPTRRSATKRFTYEQVSEILMLGTTPSEATGRHATTWRDR